MSVFQVQGARKIFVGSRHDLADGVPLVVDTRGIAGIVVWFETGVTTVTATPVDDDGGTAIPFASAASLTSGELLNSAARFYSLEAIGGPAVVHLIS